jgi:hypothetical protein
MKAHNTLRPGLELVDSCLADVAERWGDSYKLSEDQPIPYTRSVQVFEQVWPSTALGFGGIGGHAVTTAETVVIKDSVLGAYAVYFAGQHAYDVDIRDAKIRLFRQDLKKHELASVQQATKDYPVILDPLKPLLVGWGLLKNYGKNKNSEYALVIHFDDPIVFTPYREENTFIFARPDLDVEVRVPWDRQTWNKDNIISQLSLALGQSWERHVIEEGREDIYITLRRYGNVRSGLSQP